MRATLLIDIYIYIPGAAWRPEGQALHDGQPARPPPPLRMRPQRDAAREAHPEHTRTRKQEETKNK